MNILQTKRHKSIISRVMSSKISASIGLLIASLTLGACAPDATPTASPQASLETPSPVNLEVNEAVAAPTSLASKPATGNFMAISDIHFGTQADTQKYCGHLSETDAALWQAAQTKAQKLVTAKKSGFIIYTGDLPAHCDSPDNRKKEFAATLDGLATIVKGTSVPILYMPGNNDSIGADYCSFSAKDWATGKNQTPLDFSKTPTDWPVYNSQSKLIKPNKVHGYYSVYPLGKPAAGEVGLRVIALNTVIFTGKYTTCDGSQETQQTATNDQLDWLAGQLRDAAAATPPEKVIIAMHVPPGVDGYTVPSPDSWRHKDYSYMWSKGLTYTGSAISGAKGDWIQKVFLDLVSNSQTEIVSVLSGHTHLNGIRRLNNCSGTPVELNLSIPAITHDHGSNPAMKVVSYDAKFELTEDETYYAERKNGAYDWSGKKSFKFSTYYNCPVGKSCATLFDRVKAIASAEGDSQLLFDMLSVLAVKPGQGPARQKAYKEAMDTICTPYTPPQ